MKERLAYLTAFGHLMCIGLGVAPVHATDEIDLQRLRSELKGSAAQATEPVGFEVVDDETSAHESARALAEREAKLLAQMNAAVDGAATLPGSPLVDTSPIQVVNSPRSAPQVIETRFLDDPRPVNTEPAVEDPAEIVAKKLRDQPMETTVTAVEAAPTSTTMAAVQRAATGEDRAAEEASYAELQDLIKRHGAIKSELKEKSDTVAKLQKRNSEISGTLSKSEARVKSLEQQLTEARNRLMIAETEVERLSGLMLTTVRSSKSLARLDGGSLTGAAPAPRTVPAAAVSNRAAPQPATEESVATVIVDKANLRTGPGSEHSPLMSVTKGTRLLVESRRGEWYRVFSPNGARAWVSADVVAFGPSAQASPSKTVRIRAYDASIED